MLSSLLDLKFPENKIHLWYISLSPTAPNMMPYSNMCKWVDAWSGAGHLCQHAEPQPFSPQHLPRSWSGKVWNEIQSALPLTSSLTHAPGFFFQFPNQSRQAEWVASQAVSWARWAHLQEFWDQVPVLWICVCKENLMTTTKNFFNKMKTTQTTK